MATLECVQAGAALLDEHYPYWWKAVNQEKLYMGSCTRCVLAQLYGDFFEGCDKLSVEPVTKYTKPPKTQRTDVSMGFDLLPMTYLSEMDYDELKALWIAEIQKRSK